MNRAASRVAVGLVLCGWLSAVLTVGAAADPKTARSVVPPNIVLVFLDDSGWADFSPFARSVYRTPQVQRLAEEGCCFDNFYVPQAICSASRAALLTGCYPERTRVFGAIAPGERGLDPGYATMAEMLRRRGYATAVFGKWHIGDQPETRPAARGFDESCGLMYSNDMWEHHPESPEYWGKWPLRFWENGRVTLDRVTPEHQQHLTRWYTEHAVDFIRRHRKQPFFLYVPHSMPHVPLFCSDRFRGSSGEGLYADVLRELDWSIGEILKALRSAGVEDNTLVVLTSDNGPWHSYGNHAGQTPFREAKGTSFDGGVRSACIMKFPRRIPPGTRSSRAFCSIDLLPTIAHLTGAALPANPIDGMNVWDLVRGEKGATNPQPFYAFTTGERFESVLSGDGRWKLHLPHPYRALVKAGQDGKAGVYRTDNQGWALFDLAADPFERRDVAAEFPEVSARMKRWAEAHRREFY